jgi:hypothetical protein
VCIGRDRYDREFEQVLSLEVDPAMPLIAEFPLERDEAN